MMQEAFFKEGGGRGGTWFKERASSMARGTYCTGKGNEGDTPRSAFRLGGTRIAFFGCSGRIPPARKVSLAWVRSDQARGVDL